MKNINNIIINISISILALLDLVFWLHFPAYDAENRLFTLAFTLFTIISSFLLLRLKKPNPDKKESKKSENENKPEIEAIPVPKEKESVEQLPPKTAVPEKPVLEQLPPYINVINYTTQANFRRYRGFKILPNVFPVPDNYDALTEKEKVFLSYFHDKLVTANYDPWLCDLTRLSDDTFNVDYEGLGYIGKVRLCKINGPKNKIQYLFPISNSNMRLDSDDDIDDFICDDTDSVYLTNLSLEQCVLHIDNWIKYMDYMEQCHERFGQDLE